MVVLRNREVLSMLEQRSWVCVTFVLFLGAGGIFCCALWTEGRRLFMAHDTMEHISHSLIRCHINMLYEYKEGLFCANIS
jgi:hypothetical protein